MKIVPVKYLLIYIDAKTFYRIIRFLTKRIGATSDLYFMCDKNIALKMKTKLNEPNEFIRLKHEDFYMDLTLNKFNVTSCYVTISFKTLVDYNYTRYIPKPKSK